MAAIKISSLNCTFVTAIGIVLVNEYNHLKEFVAFVIVDTPD